MNPKKVRWILAVLIIPLFSLGCGLGGLSIGAPQVTPGTPPAGEFPAEKINLPGDLTWGELYQSDSGGFRCKKITGYEFSDEYGIVLLTPPDKDPNTGPFISIVGGVNDNPLSAQQLLDQIKEQGNPPQLSPEQPILLSGMSGISVELATTIRNTPVKGRIVILMVTPYQQFMLVGIAPQARWEAETRQVFEALLSTITLFKVSSTPAP